MFLILHGAATILSLILGLVFTITWLAQSQAGSVLIGFLSLLAGSLGSSLAILEGFGNHPLLPLLLLASATCVSICVFWCCISITNKVHLAMLPCCVFGALITLTSRPITLTLETDDF